MAQHQTSRDRQDAGDDRRVEDPDRPSELGGRSWWAAAKRTIGEFRGDNLTDWAAALTYYGVMSIFPALLVLVALLGLAGTSVTQSLISNLGAAAPGSVRQIVLGALNTLQHSQRSAGVLGLLGVAMALWSASRYIGAFMRAANAVYDVPEGRPVWKMLPIRLGVTVLVMVLLVLTAVMVVLTGGLARHVGELLGVGSTAVVVWDIAKWPVLFVLVGVMFAVLYWASPNAKQGVRWVSPGGVLAVVVWVVASGGFAVYVANFGSYNKTYGSLTAVIIFLVWLWISNIALLLGAELNAELERGRALAAGHPAHAEPYVELRDTTTLDKQTDA
jgi:membrane protein